MLDKELVKIVVVGHVDHGKSTVIGRLLYDTNSLPEGAVDKVKKIVKDTGKKFEYAYLLDAFEEEQKQGITIDTTQIQFSTEKREYVIIDAPGHKEFLKNMISGAANAEAALLVIDVNEGVKEQSKRHAYILSLLGIKKVYVVINKMDLVDYSEDIFNNVKNEMENFLNELGVYPLSYIPVSAFMGENILKGSREMPWFKGYSVIDAIDSFEKDKSRQNKALRFPIQDVYKFDNRRIIAGRIETGSLKVGDNITILPSGKKTKVNSIEYWAERDKKNEVLAGEVVGITVDDEFFNKRGEVIVSDDNYNVTNLFKGSIFWMGKDPLVKGKKYKLKLTTQEVECEISEIVRVIDSSNLSSDSKEEQILLNQVGEVIIKTKENIVVDRFENSEITGRFVLVQDYDVTGGGIVLDESVGKGNVESIFVLDNLKGRAEIFDEFIYSVDNYHIEKKQDSGAVYKKEDLLPIEGMSYRYPKDFDILILRDNKAVTVRDGKLKNIINIDEYKYNGYPVINGRGFRIRIQSQLDLENFRGEYRSHSNFKESNKYFSSKWYEFSKYRKIIFG